MLNINDNAITTAVYLCAPSIELLLQVRETMGAPFTLRLPCGNTFTAQRPEDIPLKNVPCPCGDPRHWFVRVVVDDALR